MKNMDGKAKAFTLIELLVVVAIIVVLIAILLPSLARAKDQSRTVACSSNLRQIGVGLATYSYENTDLLPPGNWDQWGSDAGDSAAWYTLINPDVGGVGNTWFTTGGAYSTGQSVPAADQIPLGISKIFRCPAATVAGGAEHYTSNPIVMPRQDDIHPERYGSFPGGLPMPQKLPRVVNAADIALVMDGTQINSGGTVGYSEPVAPAMDGGAPFWGIYYTGLMSNSPGTYNRQVSWTYNFDGNSWEPLFDLRWRHQGNKALNALFADGHADSRVQGSFFERNIFPVDWGIR